MRLATGPYPISGGKHVTIPLPSATLLVRAVIIGNLTPAAVTVTIAGQTSHLLPATANLFTLSSGSQGIVVTSLGTPTQAGTITAEWLTPATVPGSGYPMGGAVTNLTLGPDATVKITGPVTVAGGTVDLGAGSVVAVNAGQLTSTTIPLQAVATQMLATTFGTGSTGTVTISANSTLTSVANYRTLTVDAALTSPWEVFCSVEATGTGSISNNGGTGTKTSSTGHGGLTGTFLGGGSPTSPTAPTADFTGGAGGTGNTGGTIKPGGKAGNPLRGTLLYTTLQHYTLSGGGAGGGAGPGTTFHYFRGGGAGVVMVAAKKLSGSLTIAARGGNGVKKDATYWGGGGGGGIALVYSHTTKTWTGEVTVKPGTVTTESSGSGGGGSKNVRKKYVGAIFT